MQKRISLVLMFVGIILIFSSIYPMYLIFREVHIINTLHSRYEITQIVNINNEFGSGQIFKPTFDLASPIVWDGNSIEVITEDTGVEAPKSIYTRRFEHVKKISIEINGQQVGSPIEAWMEPEIKTDSDYLSWLNIVKIKDGKSNKEHLAIVQRYGEKHERGNPESQRWRVIHLDKDKKITIENFSYQERGKHLLGVKLVQISQQSTTFIGYKSDVLTFLPSYLFPLIYPYLTILFGIVILIAGSVLLVRRRKTYRTR